MAAPVRPAPVAAVTWAFGELACNAARQPADERPIGCDVVVAELFDVDRDPVDADLLHQGREVRDRRVLDLRGGEEPVVAGHAEARIDELDGDPAVVCLADHLVPDRTGDPLVAGLRGVDLAGLGVRDGEQAEGRQGRLREVCRDRPVHLPVRDEAEQLVTGDRDGSGRGVTRSPGRSAGRLAARRGSRRRARTDGWGRGEGEDERSGDDDGDGTDADEGPSGHGL